MIQSIWKNSQEESMIEVRWKMATTRGWALRGNIMDAINYVLDLKNEEQKTCDGIYVSSSYEDISPMAAGYHMRMKDTMHRKRDVVGYHFQFSLAPGEGTPEDCLKMAKEWIDTISKGQANYVIAVHTDKASIHAHIIADSIKKNDKFWKIYWKRDKRIFRAASDRICRKYHYSVLEETMERGRTYFEWMNDKKSDNNRELLKKVLDAAIKKVGSYEDLKLYMEKLGFQFYDHLNRSNENIFRFTADIKLVKETIEGDYLIRIPYQKNLIRVDPDYFKWLKEGKTAEIKLPVDTMVMHYDSDQTYLGEVSVQDLKKSFEDKTRKGRDGLRIRVPGSKKIIRTKFLSEDGSYSLDAILERISNNGRLETDPEIKKFINNETNYEEVKNQRRNLFEQADIHTEFKGSTIYKSIRQENYFKWRSNQMTKIMDQYNYSNLLESDRRNLNKLKQRKEELSKELKGIYEDLHKLDKEINSMMLDQIEGVLQMSEKEIDEYIKENKIPLEKRRNELKEMIRLYNDRIDKVESTKQKEQKYKKERVIAR